MKNKTETPIIGITGYIVSGIVVLAFLLVYDAIYPKVETQVVPVPTVVKECDYVCTPCDDEPPLDKCEFSLGYIAVKDSLEFDAGDVFWYIDTAYYNYSQFCTKTEDEEGHKQCLTIEAVTESGFFEPYE